MIAVYRCRVVARFPHDVSAFTQGLLWWGGRLFESTGLVGASTLREVRLEDGAVLRSVPFPQGTFGEGIALWGDEIVGVTWQDGIVCRWDRETLTLRETAERDGEGWGLASDGTSLILSDGSATVRFLDPESLAERRALPVAAGDKPLPLLNALAWVKGEILANVWGQPVIARIDPASGRTRGLIDLTPLVGESAGDDPEKVANGIAWDEDGDRLFVTGKNWPWLYEIVVDPAPAGWARLSAA
ncbi:MAG TPA: glutaminyl-peptide cyclotransferase [Allosphingosinicella sp.]|jgi:glutamine cyclotransferase